MIDKPANNSSSIQRVGVMDVRMAELLTCPVSKGPLQYDPDKQELVSATARLAYPVRDGIPILLQSEARQIEDHA